MDPRTAPHRERDAALSDAQPASRHEIERSGLVRARWLFALGQAGLVGIVHRWAPDAPLALALGVVTVGAASNAGLTLWLRARPRADERALALVLTLDVLLVTAFLALSGGAANPLSFLFLVPITLGALVLRPALTWMLVAFAAVSYASLFVLDPPAHAHHDPAMRAHLVGMWVGSSMSGALIALAITRMRRSLFEADAQVAEALRVRERAERLTALATLAAGAAHELATPLSTIAVVARELERATSDDDAREDAALIREEVDRCRDILQQLAADAGAGMGEAPTTLSLRALLDGAPAARGEGNTRVVVDASAPERVHLPRALVQQALRRLLGNARDASPPEATIALRAYVDGDHLVLEVADQGRGMAPEVLARATEPFFTTHADSGGMGLGLFFAERVAEHLSGALTLVSGADTGTRAALRLPLARALPPRSKP